MTTRATVAISGKGDDASAIESVQADLGGPSKGGPPYRLLVAFSTPNRPLAPFVRAWREAHPQTPVIGTTVAALSDGETSLDDGYGALALRSDELAVATAFGESLDQWPGRAVSQVFGHFREVRGQALRQFMRRSILALADGYPPGHEDLVDRLSVEGGLSFELVGAESPVIAAPEATEVVCGTQTYTNTLVAAEILSNYGFGVGVSHGWRVQNPSGRVTKSAQSRIHTIEDQVAAQFLGYPPPEPETTALGMKMPGGELRIRVPVRVLRDGHLECYGEIPSGREVGLAVAEPGQRLTSTKKAARTAQEALAPEHTAAGILWSSVAGVESPTEALLDEMKVARDNLEEIPFLGVRTWGELARTPGESVGSHSGAQVICLLPTS